MARHLPRIAALSGAEASRAAWVVVHSPSTAAPGALTWTVTLLDAEGVALAESRAPGPDYPVPLAEIARVHLDLVGLEQSGEWFAAPSTATAPRYCTTVRAVTVCD